MAYSFTEWLACAPKLVPDISRLSQYTRERFHQVLCDSPDFRGAHGAATLASFLALALTRSFGLTNRVASLTRITQLDNNNLFDLVSFSEAFHRPAQKHR